MRRSAGPLAMALVYGMVSLEADGSIGRVPVLTYLGDASYSIYLWHTLAISVIVKAAGHGRLLDAVTVVSGHRRHHPWRRGLRTRRKAVPRKLFSRTGPKQGALARRPL